MKDRFNVICISAVVVLITASVIGCSGGSDPEDTVRGALDAMDAMDAEKMASYFTEDVRDDVEVGMQFAFSMIDDMEISDVKIEVLSQSEDDAVVRFECNVKTTAFEQTEEGPTEQTLNLVKEDGRWLISEFDMFD